MGQRPNNSVVLSPARAAITSSLALLLLATLAWPAVAQSPRARKASLERFEEVDLSSIAPRYKKWLTEEVGHLITFEEEDVFRRLQTDSQRDIFIEEFWLERDPTPGTPRNENRDEWYERLAYVNKFFGRGTSFEGWQTDRGETYMTLGEPKATYRYPSDMLTYPAEIWLYTADPALGLPPFFYMMFYQRYGAGEYRIYSPLSDGPKKLLNGAGTQEIENRRNQRQYNSGGYGYNPEGFDADAYLVRSILFEIDYDLASAAFSLFPSDAGMEIGISPLRSEMLLGQVQNVRNVIMPDPSWAYNVLTGTTESEVKFETLELDVVVYGIIDADGEPFLHFAASAPGEHLNVSDYKNDYYFTFDANGSVTAQGNKVLQTFEMNLTGDLDEDQAARFTRNAFLYLDLVPTLPGPQRLSMMMENKATNTFGQVELEIDVPHVFPDSLALVGPIIMAGAQQLPDYDPFGDRFAFQYRDLAMIPAVDHTAYAGPPLRVFQQVLLPAGHDGVLTARAELRASGEVVRSDEIQYEGGEADEHGVIAHVWTLDTAGLSPGEYVLRVTVGEDLFRDEALTIAPQPEEAPRPFVNAQPAPPATDVWVAMERARQYRVVGDIDSALVWLRDALERDPDNLALRGEHVDLLKSAGLHEELIQVLMPAVIEDPNNPELMLDLASAYADAGEHYDAIRYYERSRMALKQDSPAVLNALANEYLADEQRDKARQLLQRSLELDADQPEIQQMLGRLAAPVTDSQS